MFDMMTNIWYVSFWKRGFDGCSYLEGKVSFLEEALEVENHKHRALANEAEGKDWISSSLSSEPSQRTKQKESGKRPKEK